MATASTTHIRKRQYQPSITSYFNGHTEPSQTSRSPLSPPLDYATQVSLLSVGMRVRKSVPEGYKTHKTLGVDGFPFPSTAPATTSSTPSRQSRNSTTASSRELTPFCGLHKIGGLACPPQSHGHSSSAPAAVGMEEVGDVFDVPGLTASHQTISSTQGSFTSLASSNGAPSKKRTFEEEIEGDMDAFFDEVDAMDTTMAGRVIARPKASFRRAATDEKMPAVDGEDFEDEDAAFLAPMDVDGV
ncbi:hypothetical protein B0A55_10943 [Friedmanniomyces simplex]|uniref:Uncharacterized protein n=1 Tax=Friedmanniomyces simplex TaxID=329884 RepID=A0A4U0WL78_9PEZI|nr:hypothetical protein B0A55_10943 [Friedmanniomyces simplex]